MTDDVSYWNNEKYKKQVLLGDKTPNTRKKVSFMSGLFKAEYAEADERLYKKGYYISNMVYDQNCYEVADRNGKVVIDNLSLAQLVSLSKMV